MRLEGLLFPSAYHATDSRFVHGQNANLREDVLVRRVALSMSYCLSSV